MSNIYFRTNLEFLRKQRGWTQLDLAKKLGTSDTVIAHWEHGRRQPRMEMVGKIADLFGVGADIIFKDLRIENTTESEYVNKFNQLAEKEKKVVINVIDSFKE